MSELETYRESKTAWAIVLANKYLPKDRFGDLVKQMNERMTDSERESARKAWKEHA